MTTTPPADEEIQDKCARIQMLTRLDDKAWEYTFKNKGGLYGFVQAERKAVVEEVRAALPVPNPREWAASQPQLAWTMGFETAVDSMRVTLEGMDSKNKRRDKHALL